LTSHHIKIAAAHEILLAPFGSCVSISSTL
jgi:hypothetical protein